ncbi:MAG: 3-ketoacyl-ACP reductase [Acidobacteriota bacterium]
MHPNRIALVTGASRGIGRAIAVSLAKCRLDLVLNYAGNESAAQETRKQVMGLGVQGAVVQADVSSAADRNKLVEFIRSEFGRLDVLVNNAGVAPKVRSDLLESSEESFDRLISTNLKGPFFLTQAVAKWMLELRESVPDYSPAIVNISSISAYTSSPNRGDYCLSKAGISMMTKLYADRLAEFGIPVFEIRPGVIATDMTAGVSAKYDKLIQEGLTPIRRWGRVEDVGKAVEAIVSGHFPFSTGEVFNVDGGFHMRRL